ncbi:hypothetical protein I0C86_27920 [Plantactinospora sp. S1510]|uniref:Class I SAM-dependent methyltransferase n=1 Tax=Plantactinospora alkalitolerans TaxID=2789879 RepID=A0ABS0H2S4_9ACTN|nr:hypothetical protein [Plantactinospora alkalitolerans]MBF9132754.1 hypothetical protein [Plantactinospora alkalitolerans]
MSEHTPHQHDQADHNEPADSTLIDLIAGDPPVPITVWRTARTGAETHTSLPTRLAYRLVAAYSRPGEAVVDLTPDHALASICARGGRRHHRAWFTDTSSGLLIGPATTDPPVAPETNPLTASSESEAGEGADPPELTEWFGDDLTDPDLSGTDTAVLRPPDDGPLDEATSLMVACWPLHEADTPARVRLAWLLAACARLLRPGGCLVLVVGVPAGTEPTPEDFGPLVAAAARAGLGYLQHIVAVEADTDGDQFVYHVITDEELLTLAHADPEQWAVAHLRVHADLLVFTPQPAKAPESGRRRNRGGGERRA